MKKDPISLKASKVSLVFGVLSLILIWVPVVGFVLGAVGLVTASVMLRKRAKQDDGHVVTANLKWSELPSILKAGVITSSIGVYVPVLVLAVFRLT